MIRKISFAAPFMVAIFSVITLYTANADRLDPGQMLAPAIFGLLVAGLFLVLFWLCKWTQAAAPFVASCFTGVFLLWHIAPWPLGVLALVAALAAGVWSKQHSTYGSILFILILVIASFASGVQAAIINAGKVDSLPVADSYLKKPGQPNIYFIVPDRLPSPAAIRESGLDPDQAVSDFRGYGFYINEEQLSADPYTFDWTDEIYTTRTMRYFASVLNGGASIPMDIPYQDCRTMIKDNAGFTWLHERGYEILNFASWFTETARFTDADLNLKYDEVGLFERFIQNELGEAYIDRTILRGLPLRVLQSNSSIVNIEVRRHDWQRERILEIAGANCTSTFVFSHIMLPHEPFVYGDRKSSIQDQYYANIRYALTYITDLAGKIRTADPAAIIIIQSDEGMAYRKPPEINRDLSPVQWSGVFSAWYIPDYLDNKDLINHNEVLNMVLDGG